jgi:hypothetical protein
MHRVIRGIFGRTRHGQIVPRFDGAYTAPNERVSCDPTAIGRKLLAMNVDAVTQRYPDGQNNPENLPGPHDAHLLPTTYQAPTRNLGQRLLCRADMVDSYKALRCLIYQCSEGNVPETALYLELERAAGELSSDIVRSLPEYEDTSW